jgi:hypothetical protein
VVRREGVMSAHGTFVGIREHLDSDSPLCFACDHHALVLRLETERQRPVPPIPPPLAARVLIEALGDDDA